VTDVLVGFSERLVTFGGLCVIVTSAVPATSLEAVPVTAYVPGTCPAVYRPVESIVPPVAIHVTGMVRVEPSPNVAVAVKLTTAPSAIMSARGARARLATACRHPPFPSVKRRIRSEALRKVAESEIEIFGVSFAESGPLRLSPVHEIVRRLAAVATTTMLAALKRARRRESLKVYVMDTLA
jgi:hypothetical protein